MSMNNPQQRATCTLILSLLLAGCFTVTNGQFLITPQKVHQGSTSKATKWEKVHTGPKEMAFRSIYSTPMQLKKGSSLSWLWIGDGQGFVRVGVVDRDSSLAFESTQAGSEYIGLSKIAVSANFDRMGQLGAPVSALSFFDNNTGYALSGTSFYDTENNGLTWDVHTRFTDLLPRNSTATIFSVAVTESRKACAVGTYSRTSRTSTGLVLCTDKLLERQRWNWIDDVPTQAQLFDVFFIDNRRGWIVGAEGTILRTDDGGESWKTKRQVNSESLIKVHFLDRDTGWAVGHLGTILFSTDGGNNWTTPRVDSAKRQLSFTSLRSIGFVKNKRIGWIIGDGGTILQTVNGGRSWQQQEVPVEPRKSPPDLLALFVDDDFCWVVGTAGTVWRYRWREDY